MTKIGTLQCTQKAMPTSLRFGIMCSGTTFQRWQASCIEELLAVPGVEPALLIVDGEGDKKPASKGLAASLTNKTLLWNVYNRFFVRGKLKTAAPVDLSVRLSSVPRIECIVERRGKYSQYFKSDDIERVRAHNLDFIIRFGFNIIRGEMLSTPRFGVWSYHHDDLDKYRGPPACFWEIYYNDPVTGVTLQRLTEGIDNGIVLHKGWFKTILKSYPRNRDAAFAGSTGFPARVCRDLLSGEGSHVDAEPSKTTAPVFRAPGNARMVRFGARLAANKVSDAAGWLFRHDQWGIGIVDSPIQNFLDPGFVPSVRWLPSPARGCIAADPFGIRRGDRTTILYEELNYEENHGRIVAVEVPDTGEPTQPREVLNLSVHLSYPYLVEDRGEIYCVPEMSQADEVALYRAAEFPMRWERVVTLVRGERVLDASIFRHDNRWWMLGTMKGPGESIGLHGWHADELTGPWTPHPCNPLKIDVRGARPGGTPFTHQGALYRPAQDLSVTYGGRIAIQRVLALTPTRFKEVPAVIVSARPDWPFPAGMHTLSAVGSQTLIDAKRLTFSPRLFRQQLAKFLGLSGSTRRPQSTTVAQPTITHA